MTKDEPTSKPDRGKKTGSKPARRRGTVAPQDPESAKGAAADKATDGRPKAAPGATAAEDTAAPETAAVGKRAGGKADAASGKGKAATAAEGPPPEERPGRSFPIIGVGASARGLDAFKALLHGVPANSGFAFVLVQHLDPDHDSMMVELLSRATSMTVQQIADGMPVVPDHVYMIPPNAYVTIENRTLRVVRPKEPRGLRMPINRFFRSLAEDVQEDAVCIVLSGTGTDGTQGLRSIKEYGGTAIVQDPASAGYDGMPKAAIATGMADIVCAPELMLENLMAHRGSIIPSGDAQAHAAPNKNDINAVLALLKARLNFDFGYYKKNTLKRRIERRMALREVDDVRAYLRVLRGDSNELKSLFKDMLISVTNFFRDPETMEILANTVVPDLVKVVTDDRPLRIWVPACASGEEAYTLAILFLEAFEAARIKPNLQIFATDVDMDALDIGRLGIYPENISGDITPERLKRHFVRERQGYRVNTRLRETVVFAAQNLIADPPFSRMDLISCRNLLIYLEPDIQKKIIPLFHFSLTNDGYLFLGSSESVGRHGELFSQIVNKVRIYRKLPAAKQPALNLPIAAGEGLRGGAYTKATDLRQKASALDDLVHRTLLDFFAPAAVLINPKMVVQYFHGATLNYLNQPNGEPTQNLLDLASPNVRGNLRALVTKVLQTGEIAASAGLRLDPGGDSEKRLKITVIPVREDPVSLMLVTFEDIRVAGSKPMPALDEDILNEGGVVRQLEFELQATREDLQSTIEELETSNEELKASNEEVMSMNEELQSTNEELETSKEELQSLNEELNTVNSQLQEKLNELESSNNDFSNLLASTDLATVFLDTDLRIKRVTPASRRLFNIIPSDIGRLLTDITFRVVDPALMDDIGHVLETLVPIEREVRAPAEGTAPAEWYWRRLLPYRTRENRIEGVVITYTNITDPKRSREALISSEAGLASAQRIAQLGSWSYDVDTGTATFSAELYRIFGLAHDEADKDVKDVLAAIEPADRDRLQRLAETTLKTGEACDVEFVIRLSSGEARVVNALAEAVRDGDGRVIQISGTVHDITDRKSREDALKDQATGLAADLAAGQLELATVLATAPLGIALMRNDRFSWVNAHLVTMTGYAADDLAGQTMRMLFDEPEDYESFAAKAFGLNGDAPIGIVTATLRRRDGTAVPVEIRSQRLAQADTGDFIMTVSDKA